MEVKILITKETLETYLIIDKEGRFSIKNFGDDLDFPFIKDRPKIICLCGSTRFKKEFEIVNEVLTMEGNIILTVGVFKTFEGKELTEKQKRKLDRLHLKKIEIADEVVIIKKCGYIGDSTTREIAYARKLDKLVHFYNFDKKGIKTIERQQKG